MDFSRRISVLSIIFLLFALAIVGRLFYWQVVRAEDLAALAASQRQKVQKIIPERGKILAQDGTTLVGNQTAYLLYANPQKLNKDLNYVAEKIAPYLIDRRQATESAQKEKAIKAKVEFLKQNFTDKDKFWVSLGRKLPLLAKEEIESFKLEGLGFEEENVRFYPEASMAAHLLGFMGSDFSGEPTGYFGLEGYWDLELKGKEGFLVQDSDVLNKPILTGFFDKNEERNGKNLQLYVDRTVQMMVEDSLQQALVKYGAKSGWIIVMDPYSGAILAIACQPQYDQSNFGEYSQDLYKNPAISEAYEPGSTFKVLVMAGAINEQLVDSQTRCDMCDGPYEIDKYTINTWNQKYYPNQTMSEVLQHSDNVGMIFVGRKLGKEKFVKYLQDFGIGEKTGIDLQEEANVPLKKEAQWSEVDLATASFGQGLVVTGIQMIRAVSAIANGGNLIEPHVAAKIIGDKKSLTIKPKIQRQVISPQTAAEVTEMMVQAVDKGDAKWAKPAGYRIAGKTGTAQIPVSGHYDASKTIASFVGFAPADKPKFSMLVYLREPTSSPWGSETAAPLFFQIAKKLLVYYDIAPTQ